ncbi:hypothetical protein FA95DRAFT_1559216 [Auriscalpium vulgare]|uniref:Uncharacterized protein n=1 Tax=Auriscalpium vulgare TaxID=40419 RepID=A0ACB8RUT2_9AGAM|nr:hypothetical protein FA95DRAFT_1559216 [Auriscalpium vulgare]
MTERRKPLEQLTPEFDPLLTKSPPKLCYGFVVEVDRLLEYALAEDVLPEDFKPKSRYTALPYVLDRLNELTGTRLRLCEPWLRVGDQFVLTIYTNYSMHRKHYSDDYDELIVEVLQEELGIEERPMWHWDASCAT